MTVPEAIAEYFEDQARWRRQKAAEYPDDTRNERCANGLENLAAFVRNLPENDERMIELGSLGLRDGLWMPPPSDSASYAIARFRFNAKEFDGDEGCDAFLTGLVSLMRDDAIRMARYAGELD